MRGIQICDENPHNSHLKKTSHAAQGDQSQGVLAVKRQRVGPKHRARLTIAQLQQKKIFITVPEFLPLFGCPFFLTLKRN